MAPTYFIVHISLAHPQFAKDGEEKRVVLTAAAWLDVSNQRCGKYRQSLARIPSLYVILTQTLRARLFFTFFSLVIISFGLNGTFDTENREIRG